MTTIKSNQPRLEVDGMEFFFETVSDFGETSTDGQAGIDPNTGQKVSSGGDSTVDPITVTAIFDDDLHTALIVAFDKPAPNPWRDGSKRATMMYSDKARFILNGLSVSSYKMPGMQGLSTDFAKISITFNYKTKTRAR